MRIAELTKRIEYEENNGLPIGMIIRTLIVEGFGTRDIAVLTQLLTEANDSIDGYGTLFEYAERTA